MDLSSNSNLDWQLQCERPHERLTYLFNKKLWTDCTFLVGDEEPETIAAHKFVLAMSSPVFDTMFNGSMPEGKGPIRVPDVQPHAFNTMLKFLYSHEEGLKSYQEASEVYCAARKYMLPFIQEICVRFLEWKLKPSNACFAHEFATLFDEKRLLTAALKKFKRKTKEILKEGSFYEAHINTVAAMFSQDQLDIDTELDLFKALERYTAETMGLKRLKRSLITKKDSPNKRRRIEGVEVTSNENETSFDKDSDEPTEDEGRLITEVRQALFHIRFLSLSIQQFSRVAQSVLLTDEEAFAIMLNLAGVSVPVPQFFSTNKQRRGLREWSPDYMNSPSTSSAEKVEGTPKPANSEVPVYEALCTFAVKNFKMRKRPVKSQPFYTDMLEWRVNVIPISDVRNGLECKMMNVLVECTNTLSKSWSCRANVLIKLFNKHNKSGLKRSFIKDYNQNNTSNGFYQLMDWNAVCSDYLRYNDLRIDVRVVATITNK